MAPAGRSVNHGAQPTASVLGKMNRGEKPNGYGKGRGQPDHQSAAIKGVCQAATLLPNRSGELGEEIPIESRHPLEEQITEDEEEGHGRDDLAEAQNAHGGNNPDRGDDA